MIRPLTCVCVLLAAGSGLYLYQTKHRTLMLDRQIADVLQQADVARARTAVLRTDYTLLSQPERLAGLSAKFLKLQVPSPAQYVQLADLDRHLPPVRSFPPPGSAEPAEVTPSPSATTDSDVEPAPQPGLPIAPATPAAPVASHPVAVALLDPSPRVYADAGRTPAAPITPRQPTRLTDASLPRLARHPSGASATAYAGIAHAEPMPMAAPRVVASRLMTTASLHPANEPARPRITTATYTPPYRAPGQAYGYGSSGGSMLGGAHPADLAPPVPVAN